MNVAFDLDGTIDSFPRVFQSLMSALMAAGHHVYVVTGVDSSEVTGDDKTAKQQYLTSLGIGPECYTELVVCPKPHPANKVDQIEELDIDAVFDNKKGTVKKAASHAAAFLLWNSKEK